VLVSQKVFWPFWVVDLVFLAVFFVGRLRMMVLVPLPFLFLSVLVDAGVVMGWWWLEERGGEVVEVGGAKVFAVFFPWWSCFMGQKGLVLCLACFAVWLGWRC
jgi:hypothetical protein